MNFASVVDRITGAFSGVIPFRQMFDGEDNRQNCNHPSAGLCPETGRPFHRHAPERFCSECGCMLNGHETADVDDEEPSSDDTYHHQLPVLAQESNDLPVVDSEEDDGTEEIESDTRASDLLEQLR